MLSWVEHEKFYNLRDQGIFNAFVHVCMFKLTWRELQSTVAQLD